MPFCGAGTASQLSNAVDIFIGPPKAFYNSSEMVVSENTKTMFKYLNFPMSGQDASLTAGRCSSRIAGKCSDVAKTRRAKAVWRANEGWNGGHDRRDRK